MNNDSASQSQTVVLSVVVLLGLIALIGLGGGIFLIWQKLDASAVAVVFSVVGSAVGALAGILASTRSVPSAAIAAQGYDKAKAELQQLAEAVPSLVPSSSVSDLPEGSDDSSPASG